MSIDRTAGGWRFRGTINGRYIDEFVSTKEAHNRAEAVDVFNERMGL